MYNMINNLKKIMAARKISSLALAEKIGITTAAMSRIMTGKSNPSLENTIKIAKELGVSVSYLIGEAPSLSENTLSITCPHCGEQISLSIEK